MQAWSDHCNPLSLCFLVELIGTTAGAGMFAQDEREQLLNASREHISSQVPPARYDCCNQGNGTQSCVSASQWHSVLLWQQEACCCFLGRSFLLAWGRVANSRCRCSLQGGAETLDRLWAAFVARVRTHLHIVLCMNPVGAAFRQRCRQFPALVNCCTIDWFLDWPAEALR